VDSFRTARGDATTGDGAGTSSLPPLRSLRDLERRVNGCKACDLHRGRGRPVVSEGPVDADLLVVGFVPRRHEDLQGRPFAGAAANVLDNALLDAGILRSEVHLSSVVRCRPDDDRTPTVDEVATCLPHLHAQIALVAPRVIVALGSAATAALLGRPVPLARVAGYRLDVLQGITLVPTYHPGDVVRGLPQADAAIRRDLTVAKAVLDGRMRTGAQTLADLRSRRGAPAPDVPAAASR
jgi:uracil-DNA glycosylase